MMMRSFSSSLFCVLIASGPAISQDSKDCSDVAAPGQRLACYDAAENPSGASTWRIQREATAVDKHETVHMALLSKNAISTPFTTMSDASTHAVLALRCMGGTTAFYVTLADNLMSDIREFGHVPYRIDEGEPAEYVMTASSDDRSLGFWDSASAIAAIKPLLEAQTLRIRATPFAGRPHELEFTVAGLDEAIKPLRASCGW